MDFRLTKIYLLISWLKSNIREHFIYLKRKIYKHVLNVSDSTVSA